MGKLRGNAIVGQSGGPTAAINATLSGVIRGALASDAIDKIYGARNGIEGMLRGDAVDLTDVFSEDTEEKLALLEKTPAAALGSCRKKLPDPSDPASAETYEKLIGLFRAFNIRYFFYIGGNDSMDTVAKLSAYTASHDYEMRIMGVPKTIDNDVMGTDHTPGFGSAAKYIAVTMQEILRDCAVYTVPAVTIVEIMGRDAGWLTASAALTRKCGIEPDLIYLPERVFDLEKFFGDVKKALEKHPNVVVAASEGIRFADGTYVGESSQSGAVDIFGHKYLSGTGKALEIAVKNKLGCKVRSIELNLMQRCSSHIASLTDINESIMVGSAAVSAAVDGVSGRMMTILRKGDGEYSSYASHEDINKIANLVKTVPDEFINEEGNGITDACVDYLLPLIEGESTPVFEHGLAKHFVIR
ncbi:MAG: 6-phosphofructokinase [Clostridia bacterium]|nr:6-phosphofructokinase [Clostridia bacterium]MBR5768390.1 6-phosphofructokinase [Clostridia bacterium]